MAPPAAWTAHLARYRQAHPKASLKQCMVEASKTYKKPCGTSKAAKSHKQVDSKTYKSSHMDRQQAYININPPNYTFEMKSALKPKRSVGVYGYLKMNWSPSNAEELKENYRESTVEDLEYFFKKLSKNTENLYYIPTDPGYYVNLPLVGQLKEEQNNFKFYTNKEHQDLVYVLQGDSIAHEFDTSTE